MEQCFGETSQLKGRPYLKDMQSKKIAKNTCINKGGIKEFNSCANQLYIKTVKREILGELVCINIYQCVGCSWTCADGYRGEITNE